VQHTDFPIPEPKPSEALICLRTASLNRVDPAVGSDEQKVETDQVACQASFTLMDLIVTGKLHAALNQSFPLKDAAAQEQLEKGEKFGKITLDIG
jgi:NADPH:quinone reductase-like Zn-dependent oxidoreductase